MPQANRDNNSLQLLLDSLLELSTLGNVIIDQVDAALDLNEEVRSSMLRDTGNGEGQIFPARSESLGRSSVLLQKLGMSSSMAEELTMEQNISDACGRSSHRVIVASGERDSLGRSSVGLSSSSLMRERPSFEGQGQGQGQASSRSLLHSVSVGHSTFNSSFRSSRGRTSFHRRNASTVGGSNFAREMSTVEEEQ